MANYIGNLSVFDHKVQQWEIFYGKLTQFIKLNQIKDENQSAVLLTHLSDESYRLAVNLVHPKKLEDVGFKEIVLVLMGHFSPKRSTFADRVQFYEATRAEGESIEEWAARLRGLAVYGEFGSELQMMLRDRFVLGLKIGPERDRLFEQDLSTLTFSKAVEIAQQAACARQARNGGTRMEDCIKEEPVFKMGERHGLQRPVQARSTNAAVVQCSVCGLKNHEAVQCRYKNYVCQKCGRKGHLKKVCRVGSARLHCIDTDSHYKEEHQCKECEMYSLRYVDYEPIKINVRVNDVQLCMELDSGSGASVISDKLYSQYFSQIKLIKSDLKMCLYNGHKITPQSYFVSKVFYNNSVQDIKFYVIQNGGPPLLGRNFMTKFHICFTTSNNNNNKIELCKSNVEVTQLLNEFPDVWRQELGCFNKFKVELHLKENTFPKFFKPRAIPFALKEKVEKEIERLVGLGILEPVTFSDYATPIVPVLKENGKLKIAGDFSCTLNKDLKIDKYPLPRIEEVFAKIGGGEHYTKLDLSNAYNQIPILESSQNLTTINTPKGLFKFTRLVYGLANAPAIFQRTMEALLSGIDGVTCWLDDVCCTGPTKEIHLTRLKEVLRRLQGAGLRLQKDKCAFFQDNVTYLGYVIDKKGLRTCPNKVEAIINAPIPSNATEVKRFLGVVNYYRNFIPNASSVLSPLHELLRTGTKWEWGERQQRALDEVKRELVSDRVLAHFDPSAPLVLAVDAGPAGLGAVLAHSYSDGTERPIAYASRSLSASEKNYSQIQKEATAIIFAVKHFHQYIYGRRDPFILKTDHRPLLSIFGKKNGISVTAALRLQRYAVILSAYNYVVQYVSSKNNLVADYFSRAPLSRSIVGQSEKEDRVPFLFLDATTKPVCYVDIKEATGADDVLQTVIKYMNHGWPRKITCKLVLPYFQCKEDLEVNNGCLLRGHRVVIPKVFRKKMLEELHSAHFGIVKTKSSARSRMWWPGIDQDIERWIAACGVCATVRSAPPRAPPSPWPRPPAPWHRIHIDYMSIAQNNYLIVVDAFSKWLECVHMNSGTSTNALIAKLKNMFAIFGIPAVIVSDNDAKIVSAEFQRFCIANGIKHLSSPIYHPSSNGQAENSVKTCKKMIRSIVSDKICKQLIHDKLLSFIFEYRNTIHCATGVTPAKLMFGRDLRSKLDLILPPKSKESINTDTLKKFRHFNVGESVWAKWFIGRKGKWTKAIIVNKIGKRMYEIYFDNYNVTCKRHIDQLIKFKDNYESYTIPSKDYNNDSCVPPGSHSPSLSNQTEQANFPSIATEHLAGGAEVTEPVSDRVQYDKNDEWEMACEDTQDPVVVNTALPAELLQPSGDKAVNESDKISNQQPERQRRLKKKIDYRQYF